MIDSNSKKEEEQKRQAANNDGLNTPFIIIDSIVDSTNNSKASDIQDINDSISSEDSILDGVVDILGVATNTIGDLSGNLLEGAAKAAEGVADILGGIADIDL